MRYVVVGGAGAMGRIIVRDLFQTTSPGDDIVIADYNFTAAAKLAVNYGSTKVSARFVDASDVPATAGLLRGAFAVINAAQYDKFNLPVMEAALEAGANYLDLGGLFHVTRKQLELDHRFKDARLVAILGIGAAPGITNVLARFAAEQLDEVLEIHIRLGSRDDTKVVSAPPLYSSYSLETILEEFFSPPAVFSNGEFKFAEPMSGGEEVNFPAPIGPQSVMYTLHSEIATLPLTYKEKGIREVSFKIAFDKDFISKMVFLSELGLTSKKPVQIGNMQIVPRDILLKLVRSLPGCETDGPVKEYEIIRVDVKGKKNGQPEHLIFDCHVRGMPEWGIGLDIDTGSPPSIAAQMLAGGNISVRGVVPPEVAVEPKPFFAELEKRGMKIWSRSIKD